MEDMGITDESQENICLVTSCFASVEQEASWIRGDTVNNTTHEFKDDGTIHERRNLYDC
jgi:hypothetical protein